jgi:hypothetical protein
MGIDLSMHHNGAKVSEKRGNLFCFTLCQTTGIDLCADGVCVVIDNAKLNEVSNALNAFVRARMAWKIQGRGDFTIDEAIDFVKEYADWIEQSANAGHHMVLS